MLLIRNIIIGVIIWVAAISIADSFSSGWFACIVYFIITGFLDSKLKENENSRTN